MVIEAYQGNILTDKLSLDAYTLIVCWRVDYSVKLALRADQNGATFFDVRNPSLTVSDLHFTGSEYKKVVIVIGEKIETQSKSCLLLLYNSISRATEKVHIFCHEDSRLDAMKSMLTHPHDDVASKKEQSCQTANFPWDILHLDRLQGYFDQSQEDIAIHSLDGSFESWIRYIWEQYFNLSMRATFHYCPNPGCHRCVSKLLGKLRKRNTDETLSQMRERHVRELPENFSEVQLYNVLFKIHCDYDGGNYNYVEGFFDH